METQKQLDERLTRIQGEIHDFKEWLKKEGKKVVEMSRNDITAEEVLNQLEERNL